MRQAGFLALVVAFILPVASWHATAPSWAPAKGYRLHYSKQLGDGTAVTMTVISRSHGQDNANNNFQYNSTLLLDGGQTFGRWVISKVSHGSLAGQQASAEFHFKLVDTGEELVIYHQKSGPKQPESRFATFCGDSLIIQDATTAPQRDAAQAFLVAHASALFLKGLRFVRSLAYVVPTAGLTATQVELEAFYGPFTIAPDARPTYTFTPQPVDCSFDAGFGFPCDKNESPNTNGLVYTEDLPNNP